MFAIKLKLFLLYMIHCATASGTRRIKDGVPVETPKKFVVYLVKAPLSKITYDSWLCGGAIVSSEFVITSAACVKDVDYMYVISGYNKYVPNDQLEVDKCTASTKKRVIYTCVPKGYQLKYGELDYWSLIDIALVRVETPFDFNDETYEKLCSYKPTPIAINYEEKYQEPGTDALVLGWGHIDKWRKNRDGTNHNAEMLRYAPTLLLNKTICVEHYEDYTNMSSVIETYMICTLGKGNIDDGGNTIVTSLPIQNGCTKEQSKILGFEGVSCEQDDDDYEEGNRRNARRRESEDDALNQTYIDNMEAGFNETFYWSGLGNGRRSGICQNDHGGPLITWSGAREILIGVASVFKVSENYDCMGPYLFTSTLCTGLFLDCILTSEIATNQNDPPKKTNRRDLCDRPSYEKGYETVERFIRWKDHSPIRTAYNGRLVRSRTGAKSNPNEAHPSLISSENNQEAGTEKHPMNKMFFDINNPLRATAQKFDNPVGEKSSQQKNESPVANGESDMNKRNLPGPEFPKSAAILYNQVRPPSHSVGHGNDRLQQNAQSNYMSSQNERTFLNQAMPANHGAINYKIPTNNSLPANNNLAINNGMSTNNGIPGNNGMPGNNRMSGKYGMPASNGMPVNNGMPANNGLPGNHGMPANNGMPGNIGMPGNNGIPANIGISGNNRNQVNTRISENNAISSNNGISRNNGMSGNFRIPANYGMSRNNGVPVNNRFPGNNGISENNQMHANNGVFGNHGIPDNTRVHNNGWSANNGMSGNNRMARNNAMPGNFRSDGVAGNYQSQQNFPGNLLQTNRAQRNFPPQVNNRLHDNVGLQANVG